MISTKLVLEERDEGSPLSVKRLQARRSMLGSNFGLLGLVGRGMGC